MSITYSLALFPSFHPKSDQNIERVIEYSKKLKARSGDRIVILGRFPKYVEKITALGNKLNDLGFQVIMYTGVWGGIDLIRNPKFLDWAQKNEKDQPLGYKGSLRSGMLCPNSPFVQSILIPEICEMQNHFPFDSIFFDMPWIMKQGCYCKWCKEKGIEGISNEIMVRRALEFVTTQIKKDYPNLKIAINAGAPGVNFDNPEAHINNLKGIFDEYVTEWNPYRHNQKVEYVSSTIAKAKTIAEGKFSHATTVTKSYKLLSSIQLENLFYAILSQKAKPWLSIRFKDKSLDKVHNAFLRARNKLL